MHFLLSTRCRRLRISIHNSFSPYVQPNSEAILDFVTLKKGFQNAYKFIFIYWEPEILSNQLKQSWKWLKTAAVFRSIKMYLFSLFVPGYHGYAATNLLPENVSRLLKVTVLPVYPWRAEMARIAANQSTEESG